MTASRKRVGVGDSAVFGTSLIFSRAPFLQKVRHIDVLGYKLADVPPSMFGGNAEMRLATSMFSSG